MKVYLTGAFSHRQRSMGHGEAAHHIYETLKKMGVDVRCKGDEFDGEPDIEICFFHPHNYEFYYQNSYKIGYTAWESTEFQPTWWMFFDNVDEIWTPSKWTESVFKRQLPHMKTFVYNHGLDSIWSPKKRTYNPKKDVFTFLNIGEPFDRKDAQLVVDTFAKLYGDDPKYRLILKCSGLNRTNRINLETGQLYSNIICYEQYLKTEQMKHLYESAHAFVYPSWGEGFGMQPLEAIGNALPTISTWIWSDYKDFITMPIDSSYEVSPWQSVHPGFMLKPNEKQLKMAMKYIVANYNEISKNAFKNSFKAHKEFNWEKVTKPAIERLKKIYNSRIR